MARNMKGCYGRTGKEIPYFLQREETSLNQVEVLVLLPAVSVLFFGLGTKMIRRIKPVIPIKGVTYRDRSNRDVNKDHYKKLKDYCLFIQHTMGTCQREVNMCHNPCHSIQN